jgi:hypothetical protein
MRQAGTPAVPSAAVHAGNTIGAVLFAVVGARLCGAPCEVLGGAIGGVIGTAEEQRSELMVACPATVAGTIQVGSVDDLVVRLRLPKAMARLTDKKAGRG